MAEVEAPFGKHESIENSGEVDLSDYFNEFF